MSTHPHRRGVAPPAGARHRRSLRYETEYTAGDNPSVAGLAAELAALDDEALAEQAALLAVAAQYATLAPLVLLRLRLLAAELARRLAECEEVPQ